MAAKAICLLLVCVSIILQPGCGRRRSLLRLENPSANGSGSMDSNQGNDRMTGLAAELATVAARYLDAAGIKDASAYAHAFHTRRRRAHHPALALDANKGQVATTQVEFMGHMLTVLALKNDEYVGRSIIATKKPFQPELLHTLMSFITPGSTVIDAGANMGAFSIFFAAQTGPSGTVYSFEPQARMYQVLCSNMIVNSLMHMKPLNKALGYEKGVLHMSSTMPDGSNAGKPYTDVDKTEGALNYGGMTLGVGGEEVQVITLDSLNLNNVSVLKVDIQGAEKLMFHGAQETIKRNMPVIAYEINSDGFAQKIAAELKLPQQVTDFNVEAFLKGLGYVQPEQFQKDPADRVMVPSNHPMLVGTQG